MEMTSRPPQTARSTDRLLEALSTLAALLDRTINEVKSLDQDFQTRLLQAVHDTEASLQSQAAEHVDRALAEAKASFTVQVNALRSELEVDRDRLNRELTRATETTAQLEADRLRLTAEVDRIRQETEAEIEKARAAAAAAAPKPNGGVGNPSALIEEVTRVETKVREIVALIEDPATELSAVIRKNVERSELESYLKGIRFAVDKGK